MEKESSYQHIIEAFECYFKSMKEGRYYDAHEDLELLWFPQRFEKKNEVLIWKGFINAAVSCELFKRGKIEASEKAWSTYLKYKVLIEQEESLSKQLYVTISEFVDTLGGRNV